MNLGFLYGYKASRDGFVALEVLSSIPGPAIAPGPQLTVLRSSPATTPTAAVWASSGYIDFVADCGADPSGVADCGPALTVAMNLLLALATNPILPKSTLTLYFPPGIFQFNDPATVSRTFNFQSKATSLRLTGEGDASILYVNLGSPGSYLGVLANFESFELDHLCIVGSAPVTGAPPLGVDCADVFLISPSRHAHIHDISILGIVAQDSVLTVNNGELEVDNVVCLASKSIAVGEGIIQMSGVGGGQGLHVHDCVFVDIGRVNGAPIPSGTVDGHSWISALGPLDHVLIENVFVDEHVHAGIWVDGSGAGKGIASVIMTGITGNGAASPGATGAIVVKGVESFELDGFASHTAPLNPYIVLVGVGHSVVKQVGTGGAIGSVFVVTADAACKTLEIVDPSSLGAAAWTVANLSSAADRTFWTQSGVRSRVLLGSPIVTGNLLKVAAVGGVAGYAPIAVGDAASLAIAVALDTPGPGGPVRGAFTNGQEVQLLSDGSTAIAIGDPITSLGAANPGQVLKAAATGATPIIARATQAAALGGGPVLFRAWVQPGEA